MELCSATSQKTGVEYIWQADPDVWGSHAPVLFPIIGALKNGRYKFKGKTYQLPKHGIVRYNETIQLQSQTESSLLFSLCWSRDTLAHFPFKFEFLTRFTLSGSKIRIEHIVRNGEEEPMYFSLGGHPAFNCPVFEGESYSDYYLEFEQNETVPAYLLNSSGLVSNNRLPLLKNSSILPLHEHLFDDDALIFKDLKSRRVTLASKKSGDIITLDYDQFPYLGIWARPAAPFICIEPWQGIADAEDTTQEFTQKEGILTLDGGETHRAGYSITFHP